MFGEQIESFLQMMAAEKGSAQNSIVAYERDLKQFLTFSDDVLTKNRIENYMQDLASRGFAPKTIARKLSAIKEFCKFLYSEKIISDNPAQNILTPKQQKPLPKFLTAEEIDSLISAAASSDDFRFHRIAVMIELMYASGMRVSELVALPETAIRPNAEPSPCSEATMPLTGSTSAKSIQAWANMARCGSARTSLP